MLAIQPAKIIDYHGVDAIHSCFHLVVDQKGKTRIVNDGIMQRCNNLFCRHFHTVAVKMEYAVIEVGEFYVVQVHFCTKRTEQRPHLFGIKAVPFRSNGHYRFRHFEFFHVLFVFLVILWLHDNRLLFLYLFDNLGCDFLWRFYLCDDRLFHGFFYRLFYRVFGFNRMKCRQHHVFLLLQQLAVFLANPCGKQFPFGEVVVDELDEIKHRHGFCPVSYFSSVKGEYDRRTAFVQPDKLGKVGRGVLFHENSGVPVNPVFIVRSACGLGLHNLFWDFQSVDFQEDLL